VGKAALETGRLFICGHAINEQVSKMPDRPFAVVAVFVSEASDETLREIGGSPFGAVNRDDIFISF